MGYLCSNLLPSAPCSYPYLPEYCKTSTLTIGSGSFSPQILSLFGLVTYHGTSPLENIGLGQLLFIPVILCNFANFSYCAYIHLISIQYYSSSPFKYTSGRYFGLALSCSYLSLYCHVRDLITTLLLQYLFANLLLSFCIYTNFMQSQPR